MSADYWLGVVTLPALALVLFLGFLAYVRVGMALEQVGITFEVGSRDADGVSDFTLRHDIWWERPFGPVFVGGWYREPAQARLITRWVGLGRADGLCLMIFRKRDLAGPPPTRTEEPTYAES